MPSPATHIVLYPIPAPGHLIPLLDLTLRFLTRHGSDRLTITILITPNCLHHLQPLLSLHASSGQLQHFLLPSLSPPKDASRLLHFLCDIHDRHYNVILDWLRSQATTDRPVSAMVSDFFMGWTQRLAVEAGVPRLSFSPSGVFGFSVLTSMWRDQPEFDDPNDMRPVVSFDKLPKLPSQPWWQMCHLYRESRKDDPARKFFGESFLDNLSSWGMIFNSFSELERIYLDHVKDQLGHGRVWAVGPLLPIDETSTEWADRGGASSVPSHQLMTWLDGEKDDSVVYVCFGSGAVLTHKQMDSLAASLETSGVHFIWAMRNPSEGLINGDIGVLGDDFVDRVGERGLVIKGWAPQVAILRHRAVGAFLTHCGWNSTLEGITAGGVVMLTWPLGADQYSNEQLLVDDLGIGIRVGGGVKKIPEPNELARLLSQSLEVNSPQRAAAKKLREVAMEALSTRGSSYADMDDLGRTLCDLKKASS